MFLWPATSDCLNGGGTFGSCLQQSLAQRGLAPAPAPEETVVAEPEIVEGEEPAEPAPVPEEETVVATAPMIDARVEPDGSTILAGTVEPNVDIQLFFNGVEVGQTTSDSAGDWIFIPDEPLPAGGVAITLRTGANGEMFVEGPEALAVVVDGESQPTVVATAPDELTDVITELTGSAPEMAGSDLVSEEEQPMEMAAIEPEDVPESSEPETATPDADLVAPEPAAEETVDEPVEEEAAPSDQAEPVTPESVTEEEPIEMAAVEPEAEVEEEQPVTAEPPMVTVEPTIDAVEIEPEGSFIAGAGQDGMTVRLFVDDQLIGESPVEGGRWLVETDEVLSESNQRIRAEMVAPGDIVTAEAEINFVIDQGESQSPAADADLILPADQLAPIALPTEAPMVVAEAPEAAAEPEAETAGELVLPGASLSEMALPLEAPAIEIAEAAPEAGSEPAEPAVEEPAESEASPETEMAMTDEADGQLQLPEDQLAPIALPTEAPPVDLPATPEEMQVAEAEPEAAAEVQSEQVILPEDQLAPISLPTEAPPVGAVADVEVSEAEPAAALDEQLILPEDQLAPIALPTEAPAIEVAEAETAPAETTTSAESIVTLPDDQLAPIALPTEAPEVPGIEVAEGADSVITVPADAAPTEEAPPVDVAEADEPVAEETMAEEPAMEVAESEQLVLPDDQLPAIELPSVAPPVPATRPAPVAEVAEAEPETEMAEEEVPTLVATPVGDPEDGRFASGKVIIRRGDNLWTIARRVYGRGIQYTVIFEANREKINNPDLIFPGQVFDLPEAAQR